MTDLVERAPPPNQIWIFQAVAWSGTNMWSNNLIVYCLVKALVLWHALKPQNCREATRILVLSLLNSNGSTPRFVNVIVWADRRFPIFKAFLRVRCKGKHRLAPRHIFCTRVMECEDVTNNQSKIDDHLNSLKTCRSAS